MAEEFLPSVNFVICEANHGLNFVLNLISLAKIPINPIIIYLSCIKHIAI